jgi:hypothetical protein
MDTSAGIVPTLGGACKISSIRWETGTQTRFCFLNIQYPVGNWHLYTVSITRYQYSTVKGGRGPWLLEYIYFASQSFYIENHWKRGKLRVYFFLDICFCWEVFVKLRKQTCLWSQERKSALPTTTNMACMYPPPHLAWMYPPPHMACCLLLLTWHTAACSRTLESARYHFGMHVSSYSSDMNVSSSYSRALESVRYHFRTITSVPVS